MPGIPSITDPNSYLTIARETATVLNEIVAEQFEAAKEEGYAASDIDVSTLAQIAQVNFLAVIAERLAKLSG